MMNKHYDHWLECDKSFEIYDCLQDQEAYWVKTKDTIFYVEGGGMERDTGTINDVEVEDIYYENGFYYHKTRVPLTGMAHMKVDVEQRIWKAQIHSGSHLLCGWINKKYHAKTIAFFTHEDMSGCEMEFTSMDDSLMNQIEREVNEYIVQDLPIHIIYPTAQEAKKHVFDSKLDHDELRAVLIGDIDYNMCGCIHVPSLRYLQAMKLLSYERTTRGYKLFFVCGNQLLKTYGHQLNILDACAKNFNTAQSEIYPSLLKLRQDMKELKASEAAWKQRFLDLRIQILGESQEVYIVTEMDDLDIKSFQILCSTVVRNYPKGLFCVCKDHDRCHVIIAHHPSLSFKSNELFKSLAEKFHLRGGGNPGMAQGGGTYDANILEELKIIVENL